MELPFNLINDFASTTGVGALCILGIFLIIDGREPNLFPTIEFYAQTKTWALVAVIPVFAISYVVGLFSVVVVEFTVDIFFSFFNTGISEEENLVKISFYNSEVLTQEYSKLNKEKELLYGSVIAFILIGIGGLSEIRNLRMLKKIILLGVSCAFIVSFASIVVATKTRYKIDSIVKSAEKIDNELFKKELYRELKKRETIQQKSIE
jgi:hypothetical protein